MGIGGLMMGNVALMARQMGDSVIGSDTILYPPMEKALNENDCRILKSYMAENLQNNSPDAVVIGNAIGRGNPELEWFWDKKPFKFYSLPEFVRERVLEGRKTIAVCGTHGKTTTTTLAAYLLKHNGVNPGWLIGGVPQDLSSGAEVGGHGTPFVIEGDEYDSAFFDKRAKFISYRPTVAVLNNLEVDHLDIYRDLEDIKRSFNHLLRVIPSEGIVIANRDDANICSLLPVKWVNTLWVSASADSQNSQNQADLVIKNFKETPEGSSFELVWRGKLWGRVKWGLGGMFNARNAAMAALAAGWAFNPQDPTALKLESLNSYVGVKRRQEIKHNTCKLVVVEDFAHHPTAVALTLQSLRTRFPGRRWVACLEPRSGTSRTNAHQSTFPVALANADISVLAPVHNGDKLPAEKRLDTVRLAEELRAQGKEAYALKSCDEIPMLVNKLASSGTTAMGVVFFSNGNFEGALAEYLEGLKANV